MEQPQSNFTQQIKSLWRNRGKIVLVTLIAGGIALIIISMRAPVYNATATLMVGNGQQRLAAIPSGIEGGLEMTYLQDIGTQIEVMKSRGVLEQTITKLEPAQAANPDYLQSEVQKLEAALTIQQVETTNLVTITVVSTDPILAQKQANAVAEAYVKQTLTITKDAIKSALEDTTQQLGELQKANVNLSISPALPRLTTQINTALPALQTASVQLQKIELNETDNVTVEPIPATGGTGIILTASQLSVIAQKLNATTSEATDIAALIQKLNLVSLEKSFTVRSSSIAVIESRIRALVTNIGSLSAEVITAQQVETDSRVEEQLRAVGEQLQVASAIGGAILEQVISLYSIQEQYITASSSALDTAQYKEADTNLLHRIIEHTTILTGTLNSASEQVKQITPGTSISAQWRFQMQLKALGSRIDAAAATLQKIKQKLQPISMGGDVLLSHADLSDMEIQAQMITTNLAALSSELTGMQSDQLDLQTTAVLISVQESVNTASHATGGMQNEIASLAANEGDTTSYTTLDTLRQQLQLALLSSDTSSTRIVDMAVVSSVEGLFTRYKSVLLAIIAGLLVSILAVLIIQYYDRTVRDASQVNKQVGLPLMASIGIVKKGKPIIPSMLDEVAPQYLESFRLLRTNLGLDSAHGKILLVSSPEAQEGKTTVAANLAMVVALQGRKVLLIDGNLRNPGIAAVFGLAEGEGLSELLTREDEDKSYITKAENVHILPGGTPSMISAEILSSPRLKPFLEKARQNYDVIIIDSAAVVEWADTRILARNVDSVLMVLQNDTSNLDLAKESKQVLEAVGAPVEGFILNRTISTR